MYKIILADDEIWVIMGLKKLIEKTGAPFQVVAEVSNGVMAMEEVERLKPDVLMTDIRMPGMDGLQLLEKIREKNLNTKVVLISGYAEFEYAQRAIRFGAADYLLKPVEQEKLEEVFDGILNTLREEWNISEEETPESANVTTIKRIIEEIRQNYTENINLTDLADKYFMSTGRLSTMLKEELGFSFSEYIALKRMQKAKELLADEALSVEEIAEMVGYKDYSYFTKVFKKVIGLTPSKYRKNL